MDVRDAYSLIARAIDSGRAAHGYLIVGGVRENASELAKLILYHLFPNAKEQIDNHSHPDVVTLEPEGKARIISVDAMRERIVMPMATTAFSGGWKVGIIFGADRLRAESANAFLKSLEEPPPKTMYLLLTDQPDAILPTIVSRSQRIDLPLPPGLLTGDALEALDAALAERNSGALATLLTALKEESEDSDVALIRKMFFRTILMRMRTYLVDQRVPRAEAFRNIDAVEDAYRRSEKSLSDDAVLSFMMERLTFPE